MTDEADHHVWGAAAIAFLGRRIEGETRSWTTEQLADFWQGATEACVANLIRLKPEMVVHPSRDLLL